MKKEKRLKHAYNNEEVCQLIFKSGKHFDWVITTAFYAAIHFVSYKIFPIKATTTNGHQFDFKTLDEYYRFHRMDIGKHPALANLVSQHFPTIGPDYEWLMDLCSKARYQNYQQSEKDAERAIRLLEAIKSQLGIPPNTP